MAGPVLEVSADISRLEKALHKAERKIEGLQQKLKAGGRATGKAGTDAADKYGTAWSKASKSVLSGIGQVAAGFGVAGGIQAGIQKIIGLVAEWKAGMNAIAKSSAKAGREVAAFAAMQEKGQAGIAARQAIATGAKYGFTTGESWSAMTGLQAQFGRAEGLKAFEEAGKLKWLGVDADAAVAAIKLGKGLGIEAGTMARTTYATGELSGVSAREIALAAPKAMPTWEDPMMGMAVMAQLSAVRAEPGKLGTYTARAASALMGARQEPLWTGADVGGKAARERFEKAGVAFGAAGAARGKSEAEIQKDYTEAAADIQVGFDEAMEDILRTEVKARRDYTRTIAKIERVPAKSKAQAERKEWARKDAQTRLDDANEEITFRKSEIKESRDRRLTKAAAAKKEKETALALGFEAKETKYEAEKLAFETRRTGALFPGGIARDATKRLRALQAAGITTDIALAQAGFTESREREALLLLLKAGGGEALRAKREEIATKAAEPGLLERKFREAAADVPVMTYAVKREVADVLIEGARRLPATPEAQETARLADLRRDIYDARKYAAIQAGYGAWAPEEGDIGAVSWWRLRQMSKYVKITSAQAEKYSELEAWRAEEAGEERDITFMRAGLSGTYISQITRHFLDALDKIKNAVRDGTKEAIQPKTLGHADDDPGR